MKIVLNQASWIGLAIFIAAAIWSVFELIVVETISKSDLQGESFTESISLTGYSGLGIVLLLLVAAYFLKNSFMQVGLVLGALGGLSIWFGRISVFVGMFPAIAVLTFMLLLFALSFFFHKIDFFEVCRQVFLVLLLVMALTLLAGAFVAGTDYVMMRTGNLNAFISLFAVLAYAAALVIISFFVRIAVVRVGLVYAASIPVIMVCTVFSSIWFSTRTVVVILFLTLFFIYLQDGLLQWLRNRAQKN